MKESITKFDLEAAFKALDEIEIPKADKVKANKPALTEIFSRKTKFDSLFEEYYDISSNAGLEDAKDAREAEIAQAKLERIEKIVDLDAESADDLLTSYVGKLIIQCPQCMTLFYKNEEDVVASEDDPSTVNVNEVCQHCGNESGYSLIGKVGEAEPEVEEPAMEEPAEDELDLDLEGEEATEEGSEEDIDLAGELEELDLNLDEEPAEEEKQEESFNAGSGEPLNEELTDDKDLDDKLAAHNEYIEYLRAAIAQEEEKLEKASNDQIKETIQRNIDAFKADLENALPDAVKEEAPMEDIPEETVEEPADESVEEPEEPIATVEEDPVEESLEATESATLTEGLTELQEDAGADTKAAISDILAELAKEDKNTWAETATKVIEVIPDNFADKLFDAIKQKASDIKISVEQKKKLIDASKGELTDESVKDCDVLGKIFALVDGFEWAKSHPELLKSFILVVLGIIAVIEPTPVVEIITLIVSMVPADIVAKVYAVLNAATPVGLAGTVANKLYNSKTESLTEESTSEDDFDKLLASPEFNEPISDAEVRAMLASEEDANKKEESFEEIFSDVDELKEAALESMISDSLVEMYGNVAGFQLKDCSCTDNKFLVEGVIYFTSGNTRNTTYTFNEASVETDKITLRGLNEKLGRDKQFSITGYTENRAFITESFVVAKK